ncbi:DUF5801 repeats-in-toxin domain-containing protein, partial [Aestuariivirga sp.]|uniref:DUF5801 repeats-in-toxin domain-containing protein n=1 Tax=Aestuariivirga sp. TaxID=2650926 RepID=UPI00391DA88F
MTERTDLEITSHGSAEVQSAAGQESWSSPQQLAQSTAATPTSENGVQSETPAAAPVAEGQQAAMTPDGNGFAVEQVESVDAAKVILEVTAEKDKPIVLPPGTQIDAILVNGDDLIIREADGDMIIVKGGLKAVPTLVIGNIEIPSEALAAALEAGGIVLPAAGPDAEQLSSGGNFWADPGTIGPAFKIRDLLPFSEFDRAWPEEQIYDSDVEEQGNRAPIGGNIDVRVTEEDLPGGLPDDEGSDDFADEAEFSGVIPIKDPDGDPLTYAFVVPYPNVTSGGQTVQWATSTDPDGNVILTGTIDGGATTIIVVTLFTNGTFTVNLEGPVDHPNNPSDASDEGQITLVFNITGSDGGAPVPATISVTIEDDSPDKDSITLTPGQIIHDETKYVQNTAKDTDAPADADVENDAGGIPSAIAAWTGTDEVLEGLTAIGYATKTGAVNVNTSGAYGGDGAGLTALNVTTSTGAAFTGEATNLFDTKTGAQIFLFTDPESGLVIGRLGTDADNDGYADDADGTIAFAIAIEDNNNSGDVSLAQYRAIAHGDYPDNNDESITLLAGDGTPLLFVSATITDDDNDTFTTTSAASLSVTFEDDGPSIDVGTDSEGELSVFAVNMDETTGADRYNTGESESAPANVNDNTGSAVSDPTGT